MPERWFMADLSGGTAAHPPLLPRKLALFVRALPPGAVESRVQRLADHGLTWVAIGTVWQDLDAEGRPTQRWINTPVNARRIVAACVARGIVPWLWGHPCRGRELEFAEDLGSCATPDVVGVIPDPERRSKGRDDDHDGRVEPAEMQRSYADARELYFALQHRNPYWSIGVTSYGLPRGHPTLPWSAFFTPGTTDWLSEAAFSLPQLYDEDLADMRRGLRAYRDLGANALVPAYGTYRFAEDGSTPNLTGAELDQHLGRLLALRDEFGFAAMIGWSEAQVSAGAWQVIEKYARLFG